METLSLRARDLEDPRATESLNNILALATVAVGTLLLYILSRNLRICLSIGEAGKQFFMKKLFRNNSSLHRFFIEDDKL